MVLSGIKRFTGYDGPDRDPIQPVLHKDETLRHLAQFLNVIEGVLGGMTRAVINNSDYPDSPQMKLAISRHFSERNEHFRHKPRRVGNKIWEFDFFEDFDALRAGNYKDW